jgi:hypothetical protein
MASSQFFRSLVKYSPHEINRTELSIGNYLTQGQLDCRSISHNPRNPLNHDTIVLLCKSGVLSENSKLLLRELPISKIFQPLIFLLSQNSYFGFDYTLLINKTLVTIKERRETANFSSEISYLKESRKRNSYKNFQSATWPRWIPDFVFMAG